MDTPDLTSYIVDRLSDAVPLNDIVMEIGTYAAYMRTPRTARC